MNNNDNFVFEYLDDLGGYKIVKYTGEDRKVVIPDVFNDSKVLVLGYKLFYLNKTMEEVVLGENITTIEISAFKGAKKLRIVEFNENLVTISNNAFEWCDHLRYINLPKSVKYIGANAFKDTDKSLAVVLIKSEDVTISPKAFGINYDGEIYLYRSNANRKRIETDEDLAKTRINYFRNKMEIERVRNFIYLLDYDKLEAQVISYIDKEGIIMDEVIESVDNLYVKEIARNAFKNTRYLRAILLNAFVDLKSFYLNGNNNIKEIFCPNINLQTYFLGSKVTKIHSVKEYRNLMFYLNGAHKDENVIEYTKMHGKLSIDQGYDQYMQTLAKQVENICIQNLLNANFKTSNNHDLSDLEYNYKNFVTGQILKDVSKYIDLNANIIKLDINNLNYNFNHLKYFDIINLDKKDLQSTNLGGFGYKNVLGVTVYLDLSTTTTLDTIKNYIEFFKNQFPYYLLDFGIGTNQELKNNRAFLFIT